MNVMVLYVVIAVFAVAAGGFVALWLRERVRAAGLEARLQVQADGHERMSEMLRLQAAQSANEVAEALVKRADESYRNRELLAQERLENQLKPVAETLAKFQEQVAAAEKQRAEEQGGLKQQIAALMQASVATQDEARRLSTALRRGAGVQGRWGEQMLRNVLELAGLRPRIDFEEQVSGDTEEGRRRPDATVRLPGGGLFVIDAKCSLNAFLEAIDAPDEAGREAGMVRHTASVRSHIQSLAAKAYWTQFDASPDFVAMFIPGESFLAAALERNPELMTEAMDRKVILVTPTTLFGLCKAVAYGWRVEQQAENAQKIANQGADLYKRLATMGAHVVGLGKSLDQAVNRYNDFVGSLETKVLPAARRFEELAADHQGKEMPELTGIETQARPAVRMEALAGSATSQPESPTLTVGNGGPTSLS